MLKCQYFNLFRRGISSQGLKHEYGKRRLSRDLMVSKDVLSLKTREGRFLEVLNSFFYKKERLALSSFINQFYDRSHSGECFCTFCYMEFIRSKFAAS